MSNPLVWFDGVVKVDEEVVDCTVRLGDGDWPDVVAFATVSEEVYLGRIQKNSAIVKT